MIVVFKETDPLPRRGRGLTFIPNFRPIGIGKSGLVRRRSGGGRTERKREEGNRRARGRNLIRTKANTVGIRRLTRGRGSGDELASGF